MEKDNRFNGRQIAADILKRLRENKMPRKVLAAILVGENEASESFLKIKKRMAEEVGADFRIYRFDEDMAADKLRAEIVRIGMQGVVGGLIVQLPLPERFSRRKILNAIPVKKDVDLLGERARGKFLTGGSLIVPPVIGVIKSVLKEAGIEEGDLKEMRVGIVGAGWLVGQSAAAWFLGKAKELIIFEKGSDLKGLAECDLAVFGAGEAKIVKSGDLKKGAVAIDFGYDQGKGDLDTINDEDNKNLKMWTPTPGGTGPVLAASLLKNFYDLQVDEKKR